MNLDLFTPRVATAPAGVRLRPYQQEACDRIDESLRTFRSTLASMATGTGKTTVFGEAVRRRAGRCLVLAHREELIEQASARIASQTGRQVSIEKADRYAPLVAQVVVASVQTLKPGRLERWPSGHFELVVVDEAHHAVADSYTRILKHFDTAKVLGVTATPDRGDERAMGQVFEDVAFVYDIGQAIDDDVLCKIRATQVFCDSIDLSGIKTVAGDLSADQLDAVMQTEQAIHEVVRPTLDLSGDRRTLVFTTSVALAHRMAEVFNRYRPDCARAVDGKTEAGQRKITLLDHQAGRYQFLVNVGVLTEGYDDPRIACVSMGRPTKSRALYAQMLGRGTRKAPDKADLLVLDFVGNTGRHRCMGPADVLGGKYPDDVVDRAAKAMADDPGADVLQALKDAERAARMEEAKAKAEEERRLRAKGKAEVKYKAVEVDPFTILGVRDPGEMGKGSWGDEPATDKQIDLLKGKGVELKNLTKRGASRLIGEIERRRLDGLSTFKQSRQLQRLGYDTKNMTFDQASALMSAVVANNWRRLTQQQEEAVMRTVNREPGVEG